MVSSTMNITVIVDYCADGRIMAGNVYFPSYDALPYDALLYERSKEVIPGYIVDFGPDNVPLDIDICVPEISLKQINKVLNALGMAPATDMVLAPRNSVPDRII